MPKKKFVAGIEHPIERTKLYNVPAIELAKSIIDKDRASHIHIPVLADKAGINEFKLKISFRGSTARAPINTAYVSVWSAPRNSQKSRMIQSTKQRPMQASPILATSALHLKNF